MKILFLLAFINLYTFLIGEFAHFSHKIRVKKTECHGSRLLFLTDFDFTLTISVIETLVWQISSRSVGSDLCISLVSFWFLSSICSSPTLFVVFKQQPKHGIVSNSYTREQWEFWRRLFLRWKYALVFTLRKENRPFQCVEDITIINDDSLWIEELVLGECAWFFEFLAQHVKKLLYHSEKNFIRVNNLFALVDRLELLSSCTEDKVISDTPIETDSPCLGVLVQDSLVIDSVRDVRLALTNCLIVGMREFRLSPWSLYHSYTFIFSFSSSLD